MKVLQINSVCGIRSTGRICTDIADVLKQEGHECKIAYGREFVPEKYQDIAVRIGSDLDVKLHGLRTRLFDSAGLGSKRATQKFIKWVEEYDPDVIHLHNIHGYYINIEVLFEYLARANKPVVWTLHDCWSFTGHCVHFERIGCEKWREGGCHHCPSKKRYPSSSWRDASQRNFKLKKELFTAVKDLTLVTPSVWLGNLVKQSFLGEKEVRVIPNGIDLSVFKPTESDFRQRHRLEDKKIILGVATAWGKAKGLDDFVTLSERLDET
ncbi:MAG: glycosyltransferase, partial [Clostridia bacterium]|nr:glycosyltransferase [Clostridia bacterium]